MAVDEEQDQEDTQDAFRALLCTQTFAECVEYPCLAEDEARLFTDDVKQVDALGATASDRRLVSDHVFIRR